MAKHLMVRTQDIVDKGLWRLWPVINCDKTKDIPVDYPGAIGVPITYMGKHDPERFELLGMVSNPKINGQNLFKRLVIRNLHPDLPEVLDLTEWFERMGEPLIVEEGQEMSVLIKGMDMPKEGCKDCLLVKRGQVFDICPFLKREVNGNVERGGKPYDCPLVPVLPHGRLIDADELHKAMYHRAFETDGDTMWQSGCWVRYRAIEQVQDSQPTIIEAEEG